MNQYCENPRFQTEFCGLCNDITAAGKKLTFGGSFLALLNPQSLDLS